MIRWVGGWVKKGQNHDDVILEWSLKMVPYIDKLQKDTQRVQILSEVAFRFFLRHLLFHAILCEQSFGKRFLKGKK